MKPSLYRNAKDSLRLGAPGRALRSIIIAFAVLTGSGCLPFYIPPDNGPERPKNLDDAPLEVHVAYARSEGQLEELAMARLPRDLSVRAERGLTFMPKAMSLNNGFLGLSITSLEFRGVADGRICFGVTDWLDADSSESAEEISANFQNELEVTKVWVEAVASLDALTGRKGWPAGASATRLVSAEVIGDEVETFTEKQPYGDDGEYVEVKKERRVVELEVCGNGFELPPGSNYLVGVMHVDATKRSEQWSPSMAEIGGREYEDRLRMQHDSLLLWALTDDGTIDLSK
jgi:hypothetical protein